MLKRVEYFEKQNEAWKSGRYNTIDHLRDENVSQIMQQRQRNASFLCRKNAQEKKNQRSQNVLAH